MKKLAVLVTLLSGLFLALLALPVNAAPSYCSAVSPSYLAVYNYPTGSYWQKQLAAYPDYYASYNSFYMANYHC